MSSIPDKFPSGEALGAGFSPGTVHPSDTYTQSNDWVLSGEHEVINISPDYTGVINNLNR